MKHVDALPGEQETVVELRAFFFEAMTRGGMCACREAYACGEPGLLRAAWAQGPWSISVLLVQEGKVDLGSITIVSRDEIPVWKMTVNGRGEGKALQCIRAARYDAYCKKKFYAGRGAHGFSYAGGLTYCNTYSYLPGANLLASARGVERVQEGSQELCRFNYDIELVSPLAELT